MSTAFLHVGQCGNQLGQVFWQETEEWNTLGAKKTTFSGSRSNSSCSPATIKPLSVPFSLVDDTLPCILVDTEPKVIRRCVKSSGIISRKVPKEFLINEQAGRGNNWAYGYYGRRQTCDSQSQPHMVSVVGGDDGGTVVDRVKEKLRKLVEKSDRFGGTVLFHSIAGGTGSGLSCALLEHLREDYPLAYIISVAVAPFSFGEIPLQHYNSLLCLSWLQTYCDAIMLFQNDSTLEQVQNVSSLAGRVAAATSGAGSSSKVLGGISMEDMNKHISRTLCNCFLPVWDVKQRSSNVSGRELWEFIRSICPDPATKFITSVHTHSTKPTTSWDQLLTRLMHSNALQKKHTISTSSPLTKVSTSSVLLVSRSSPPNMDSLVRNISSYEKKLKHILNTVEWNPFPIDYWFSYEPSVGERKTSSLLVNSTAVLDYLDSVYRRAALMYREGAYIHWYEKYGCEKDTFKEALKTVESIIQSYESL